MTDTIADRLTPLLEPLADLRPHPQNYRQHPDEQVDHLVASLERNGVYRPIVVSDDGYILAGHGVALAAARLGLAEVPVVRVPLAHDDPRAVALLVGDNEVSRLADDDDAALLSLLRDLAEEDDSLLFGIGYVEEELAHLADLLDAADPDAAPGAGTEENWERYTSAVNVPQYEPTSDAPPPVRALYDTDRTTALLARIEAADLTPEVRHFLTLAANRHTSFDYRAIAEFYAHADASVQQLMEESALVIIDVGDAIRLGYARLSEFLDAEAGEDLIP